jgi:hypothetical protein
MRPVLHGDVSCAARAMLCVPAARRPYFCAALIARAHAADLHVRRTARLHPRWGNGSLMAVARKHPMRPEPGFDDPEYCACFSQLMQALIRFHATRRRS